MAEPPLLIAPTPHAHTEPVAGRPIDWTSLDDGSQTPSSEDRRNADFRRSSDLDRFPALDIAEIRRLAPFSASVRRYLSMIVDVRP